MPSGAPWFPVEQPPAPPPAALDTHLDRGQFQILNCIFFFHENVKRARKHENKRLYGMPGVLSLLLELGLFQDVGEGR